MTVAERQPLVDTLNQMEAARLLDLEKTIKAGISTFAAVGEALTEIRDNRLYRATDASFGAYTERAWGFSRQRAAQLIGGAEVAHTLSAAGVEVTNERQARDLKKAAAIYEKASPAAQLAFARVVQKTTGTQEPTTAQINAVSCVIEQIDAAGVIEDPETGEHLQLEGLDPGRLDAILRENVTTATYESTKRKESHIQEKILESNQTGRGGWQDWCMSYTQQNLTDSQELRIVVKRDGSGNSKATALIVDTETHATVAFGDSAGWLKKAVMSLVEEVKGV
ncbi:hypothetical protein Q0M94_12040 [Deinococcus radiomollis]|uniref:hypothetical protein n=1 Tax=Deinococcus radiomollis TaxID=468916 RepID=UPI003891CC77